MFDQWPDEINATILKGSSAYITDGTPLENNQLQEFSMQLFKFGSVPNVSMVVKAYTTSDVLLATSEAISTNDIPSDTDYFYGWFMFKFEPRINLTSASGLRFRLELSGYTFSESGWIAMISDWPVTMGYNASPDQIQDAPIALDFLGAR